MASKARAERGAETSLSDDVMEEASLVAQIGQGDRESLEMLYRRHGPSLLALLTRMFDDHQMAEEVVQDTFLAVWNGARFDGRSRVRTWLVAIAIRQAGSRRRRRRFPLVSHTPDLASEGPSPEDTAVGRLGIDRLVREISELTRLQRESYSWPSSNSSRIRRSPKCSASGSARSRVDSTAPREH